MKSKGFDNFRLNRYQDRPIFSSTSLKCLPLLYEQNEQYVDNIMINVPLCQTAQHIKLYQWRSKTEFPIAKITRFSIKQSNPLTSLFQVQFEKLPLNLSNLKDIPLFKMLYLLKESIIGFERLFHSYGSFMVTPKMIALNVAHKCKVWFNENFSSNSFEHYNLDEKFFLLHIYKIFQVRGKKVKHVKLFFEQLNQCTNFCSAYAYIDGYAKINKISIPTCCKVTEKEILRDLQKNDFNVCLTMHEPPKSLKTSPIRNSLERSSKCPRLGTFTSFSIEDNEKQGHGQVSIKPIKSEETAAELFQKKSNGLQFDDQFFLQHNLFKNQISSELIARSQLQLKLKTKLNLIRRFSEQYPKIKCLSPTQSMVHLISPQKLQPHILNSKWNRNSIIDCQNEQKMNIANLFNKNKWQKSLNALFVETQEQDLKKSVYEGKQQSNIGICCSKFQLLDKLGKSVQQSFINEEIDAYQY